MSSNKYLDKAQKSKNDEFYTQMKDIEKELKYYKEHFVGKTVYCNADNPFESNFFKYFVLNFNEFKLKKLIATHYIDGQMSLFKKNNKTKPVKVEIDEVNDFNIENNITTLKGNGDFRNFECVDLLKKSDIVVTNPPFSLFIEYVAQLTKHKKKFLIIGNLNAITYKNVFPLIKNNKMWLGGSNLSLNFRVPDHYGLRSNDAKIDAKGDKYLRVGQARWFTNLDFKKQYKDLVLNKKYNELEYPKYDNYDGINVNKTEDIPMDYDGVMGVPITFLDKYNPNQFEIIGFTENDLFTIKGKLPFKRILIKRKK